ncbi:MULTISPECIES: DUF3618 domain-containing protein [Thermomonospora]|uniref:DUF3618 domain-containing protein n=1 Tax=Thermomonospora cellulosilytica TaxID=1411118 RepID=A0A7W3N4Z6_9ACTN|nr:MULTISPECIES: DUF3618 domain-containing protein [Thermomonospora]MBA9007641.1 hypothetical protein [Thermomonospora cellulosilytica]
MADRARDPEALEKEIEATRKELARTIDAIADRVNPRNVAQRGVTRLKEEAGQVAAAVGALVVPSAPGEDGEPGGVDRRVVAAGVGAVVAVTVFVLWRRGRRRRG